MSSIKEILDIFEEGILLPFKLFFDPKKRVFILYLLTSLILAYLVYIRLKVKGTFTNYVFSKKIWFNKSAWVDYKLVFFNSIFKILLIGPYLLVGFYLAYHLGDLLTTKFGEHLSQLPIWALIFLYTISLTIINDLGSYLVHYAFHYIPILWEFHKVHHSATSLNPMTQYRVHPIELLANNARSLICFGLVTGLFEYWAGQRLDVVSIIGVNVFSFLFLAFGANLRHSHIKLSYNNKVEYVLISPFQHQIHHSNDKSHYNKNMGSKLAIWDWMFDTLIRSKEVGKLSFGLGEEDKHYNSFWKNVLVPFKNIANFALNYFK